MLPFIFELQEELSQIIINCFEKINKQDIQFEKIKDLKNGDISCNVALIYAKRLQIPAIELANEIANKIQVSDKIAKVEVAKAGFINIFLDNKALFKELYKITANDKYGYCNIGNNQLVNVEYVSTNPTGPMHIGHGRNAVFGDCIANILENTGYRVVREYYINDAGGQTIALAKSVFLRYQELLGKTLSDNDFDEDMYKGNYLISIAQKLQNKYHNKLLDEHIKNPEQVLEVVRLFSIDEIMQIIRNNLKNLGINMDVYTSEMQLGKDNLINEAIEHLNKTNNIYYGLLEAPQELQQKLVADDDLTPASIDANRVHKSDQLIFKSSLYGDDIDRVLKKSNGELTYFAGDVGYHFYKIKRGFNKIINILGFDHIGYIKRLSAAVKALDKNVDFFVKTVQMVNFLDNGNPVRMSKRSGSFVTIEDLINKVGKDTVRFMMISRHQDMQIDFDFQKAVELNKDNHLFYIQYANARIHSVIKNAQSLFKHEQALDVKYFNCFEFDIFNNVIKILIQWPKVLCSSSSHLEPHRISNYLYDLATSFHQLWNEGKTDTALRFLDENNKEKTTSNLILLNAISSIISQALKILGITPLKEMR